jgi:hypothetical protein
VFAAIGERLPGPVLSAAQEPACVLPRTSSSAYPRGLCAPGGCRSDDPDQMRTVAPASTIRFAPLM